MIKTMTTAPLGYLLVFAGTTKAAREQNVLWQDYFDACRRYAGCGALITRYGDQGKAGDADAQKQVDWGRNRQAVLGEELRDLETKLGFRRASRPSSSLPLGYLASFAGATEAAREQKALWESYFGRCQRHVQLGAQAKAADARAHRRRYAHTAPHHAAVARKEQGVLAEEMRDLETKLGLR